MKIQLYSPPSSEPVTLDELKLHLRLDSASFSTDIAETQSIAPGPQAITTGYTLIGSAVQVIGLNAIVQLLSGTNGATGTVDVKIQESDDGLTWNDWPGGSFNQITTANDNATYSMAYTGTKEYIRTVAQVLLAACNFGTSVITKLGITAEDDLLNDLITASRETVEDITRRALLTQTWDYYIDEFPTPDNIKLPFGNLQSVVVMEYYDCDHILWPMVNGITNDYVVELNGDQCGRIVLPYDYTWPGNTLWSTNPIHIQFICGWTSAALIPSKIKTAIKFQAENFYQHGGRSAELTELVQRLLSSARLWDNFNIVKIQSPNQASFQASVVG